MRVDFDALAPDGYGELEFITLNVSPREQNAKTRPLYYESVVRPGVDFDVRAIEDVPSEISLNADTEASVEGIEIDLSVVSASVPIDAPARAPPSRKASCVMTPPHRACSLTDGDFEDEYYDGNRRQPVAIDLGRVFAARLVVFHGCFIDCTLETSPDGKSWRSKTFDTPHDQVIFWEEPGRVRFVRVAGEDTRHGREVSVWE